MRCKKQMEIKDPVLGVNKRGVRNVSGSCVKCNTKIFRFLKKIAENQPTPETAPKNEPISPFITPMAEFKGERTTSSPQAETNEDIEKEIKDWDETQL